MRQQHHKLQASPDVLLSATFITTLKGINGEMMTLYKSRTGSIYPLYVKVIPGDKVYAFASAQAVTRFIYLLEEESLN